MYYTIDRFEGYFAVCENRSTKLMVNIPRWQLPKEAKEGDIITFEHEEYVIDKQKTEEIKKEIKNNFDSLWQ